MKSISSAGCARSLRWFVLAHAVIGPDVTVSTIGDTFTKYGTINGVSSYAMTTVSCNLGDQMAIWVDCTSGTNCNRHPVIAQTLYRLKTVDGATRFEQIGTGWLKHGFCGADASGPNCGTTCNNDGTCDGLGVGCTDTYGAGLNADQTDLGPRSEINAWTGAYPYPYVRAWNQTGDSIYKRLQVKNVDLDPAQNPGANSSAASAATKYFAEVQYVVTDELPARRFNNVSYRRATVGTLSGGGYNMSFSAPTVPQQPAIMAWPANDPASGNAPAPVLVQVDVPNEGRFILGYKVTRLQNGMYRYEYALYNMNSDRSAQSFTIDAPDWVTYSNQGTSFVPFHSGEPYSSAAWQWSKDPGVLTWETETFDRNANANAVRWGFTYNFRVDSSAPPRLGTVRIGLFKPGTPTEISASVMIPGAVGDMNCDSVLNNFDIDPFVLGLTDAAGYAAAHPGCDRMLGDINGDHAFDNFDIDSFVTLVIR